MDKIDLSIFKDALEETYPERYDIVEDTHIIIHFPEIEISNENKKSLKIYNLFTIFKFENYLTYDYIELHGWLMSPTRKQYLYDYAHSHLPISDTNYKEDKYNLLNDSCPFCLGNGTLNKLICSWQDDFTNISIFECILYELENFVSWESLEGGPYIFLNKVINNSDTIDYDKYYTNCNFKYVINKLYESNESIPVKIIEDSKINKYIELYYPLEFKSKLSNIIENTITEVYTRYSLDDNDSIFDRLDKNRFIPFRGKNIKLEIYKEDDNVQLELKNIKNDIIEYILEKLIRLFNLLPITDDYYEYINNKK